MMTKNSIVMNGIMFGNDLSDYLRIFVTICLKSDVLCQNHNKAKSRRTKVKYGKKNIIQFHG